MASPPLNVLSLCSGVAALDLGVRSALGGSRVVCYVEREAFCVEVLASRMEEGFLDQAPVWSDLATFDGKPWRGVVDLVVAGFSCQPWSLAGKRLGVEDERWLWPDIERILREVRPSYCYVENVPGLISGGGLDAVLGGLASLGFDAVWDCFSAAECGAPHERERVYILADATGKGLQGGGASVTTSPRELWPTPTVKGNDNVSGLSSKSGDGLQTAAKNWPTPCANDHERSGNFMRGEGNPTLPGAVKKWPTPTATPYGNQIGGGQGRVGPVRESLETLAKNWATPCARDSKGAMGIPTKGGRNLPREVLNWPTPTAQAGTGYMSGSNRDTWRSSLESAALGLRQSSGRPDKTISKDGDESSRSTRRLNPVFAEFLMGWSLDWTRIAPEPLEMESSPKQQNSGS